MDLILIDGTEVFVVPNKICAISPCLYKELFHKKRWCTDILMVDGSHVLVKNDYAEIRAKMRFCSGERAIETKNGKIQN